MLTDPHALEHEALLRDVCPLAYVARPGGGYDVGCARCDIGEPFDPGAFTVEPLPRECAEGRCFGAMGPWMVGGVTHGSFTRAGTDEAVVTLGGSCNPKHMGVALLRRTAGRWSVAEHSPVGDFGTCFAFRRTDGRDLAVCVGSILSIFGDADVGRVVGWAGEGTRSLFSIPHGDGVTRCMSEAERRRFFTNKAGSSPRAVAETFLDDAEPKDVNGDGRKDLVVHLVEKRLASLPAEEDATPALREKGGVVARPTLVFLHDGHTLQPDPATRKRLRTLCAEP